MDEQIFNKQKGEFLQEVLEINDDIGILLNALDKAIQKYKSCMTSEEFEKIIDELNIDLDKMKHLEVYD